MDDDIAIKVEHVSKKYCKSLKRSMLYGVNDILRNSIGMKTNSDRLRKSEFWAVDDVSFEVKKGETLGIIGPNGSGKTTMLKMLNGIFWPDKGKITINGRMGALIAVGAGFHPMLTGRENIYVNAAILGMTKDEVDQKFDDIVRFANIGDFLDTPVKFYSSGMYVRLGFAIAVHCEPEILLVDEVLAVGDRDFILKCLQKFHEIRKRGTTIILVSHNEYTIREIASQCLYLQHGKEHFYGNTEEALTSYVRDTLLNRNTKDTELKTSKNTSNNKIEIDGIIIKKDNIPISYIESGDGIQIEIDVIVHAPIKIPIIDIGFGDEYGLRFHANTLYDMINMNEMSVGKYRINILIPHLYLPENLYKYDAFISDEDIENHLAVYIPSKGLIVGRAKNSRGTLKLPTKWDVEKIE